MASVRLQVEAPSGKWAERTYICSIVFGDGFGLDFDFSQTARKDWRLSFGDGKELLLPDVLFACAQKDWLAPASLPKRPLAWVDPAVFVPEIRAAGAEPIPVVYGERGESEVRSQPESNGRRLAIDILGSCFFMLSRYEEAISGERDSHGRFSAQHSIAAQEGFLDRPLVDEYTDLLWGALTALWPQLRRRPRESQLRVSHDVDAPFLHAFQSPWKLARAVAGDVIKRRRFRAGFVAPRAWLRVRLGSDEADPFYTFDWIMDRSESVGMRSAFYFICGRGSLGMDGDYEIDHPRMRRLLRRIHQRGHEIGLHGSYETIDRPAMLAQEFDRLKRVCGEEGISQEEWGGRQHYLRWRTPTTARAWAAAGLDYDSTLTFADQAGFRCGTCREFPFFDVEAGVALSLRERPLIAMDATVLDERYQALSHDAAFDQLQALRRRCESHHGDFSLLWHNSRLTDPADRDLYERIVAADA